MANASINLKPRTVNHMRHCGSAGVQMNMVPMLEATCNLQLKIMRLKIQI